MVCNGSGMVMGVLKRATYSLKEILHTQRVSILDIQAGNYARPVRQTHFSAGGRPVTIQVDGGVKAHNIAMLRDWGVSNCVVGSGLFNDSASVADNLSIIHQALG